MKPLQIAAMCCVYNDDIWLSSAITSIYETVEAIVFLVSKRPWSGTITDDGATLKTIKELPDPQQKIRVVCGDWDDQTSQRNYGLAYLQSLGFQYCFVIDADEVYDQEALTRMLQVIERRPEIDVWHVASVVYWKSPSWRIDPPEAFHPPVVAKLGSARFVEYRNLLGNKHELIQPAVCFMHHLSYARSDQLIWRKIHSISAAPLIRTEWFEKVWKAWDSDHTLENLHPVAPDTYKRAVPVSFGILPKALKRDLLRATEQEVQSTRIPGVLNPASAIFGEGQTLRLNRKPLA